jgi:hypothetical protein
MFAASARGSLFFDGRHFFLRQCSQSPLIDQKSSCQNHRESALPRAGQ